MSGYIFVFVALSSHRSSLLHRNRRILRSLAIIYYALSHSRLGNLLGVRFFAQQTESNDHHQLVSEDASVRKMTFHSPPLVVLALGVRLQVVLALKPLGALDTKVPTEAGEILSILGGLVLRQVPGGVEVRADLIVVPAGVSGCHKHKRCLRRQ